MLISYSWTTEYCCWRWHSAHFPDARTKSAVGCAVSTRGRARFIRNAATINPNEMTTAMKTGRNDIRQILINDEPMRDRLALDAHGRQGFTPVRTPDAAEVRSRHFAVKLFRRARHARDFPAVFRRRHDEEVFAVEEQALKLIRARRHRRGAHGNRSRQLEFGLGAVAFVIVTLCDRALRQDDDGGHGT